MSWGIESERLDNINPKMNQIEKILRNRVLHMKMGELVYLSLIYYFWGFQMLLFAIGIAFGVQMVLEIINYVEHYGLRRKEIAPGKYERVGLQHSWNASYALNNVLYFRLARHSDHHETGSKPYQALQNSEQSPQLPFSYSVAFILSMDPKLWFEIMDPLVEIYQEQKRQPTEAEKLACQIKARKAVWEAAIRAMVILTIASLF